MPSANQQGAGGRVFPDACRATGRRVSEPKLAKTDNPQRLKVTCLDTATHFPDSYPIFAGLDTIRWSHDTAVVGWGCDLLTHARFSGEDIRGHECFQRCCASCHFGPSQCHLKKIIIGCATARRRIEGIIGNTTDYTRWCFMRTSLHGKNQAVNQRFWRTINLG
jgi:hypothetical protein